MIRTLLLLAATAVAATPLAWKQNTRWAELSLTLPAVVAHAPVLHDRLYRGEMKALQAFAAEAAKSVPGEPARDRRLARWEMDVTYEAALETPRLISLSREAYQDSHAAHPDHQSGGVVFDKATNTRLHPVDLLRPSTDLRNLDRILCDAARAAKRERAEGDWDEKADSNFHCPTWRGVTDDKGQLYKDAEPVQYELAVGDAPGRAAGLVFVYSPYAIGTYVEGAYQVVVPLAAFRQALKPDYAGEFAGGRPRPASPLE